MQIPNEVSEESLYRHFKGDTYYVHFVAKHSETEEHLVVYQKAEVSEGGVIGLVYEKPWCRPLDNFCSSVEVNGELVPRFTLVPK